MLATVLTLTETDDSLICAENVVNVPKFLATEDAKQTDSGDGLRNATIVQNTVRHVTGDLVEEVEMLGSERVDVPTDTAPGGP